MVDIQPSGIKEQGQITPKNQRFREQVKARTQCQREPHQYAGAYNRNQIRMKSCNGPRRRTGHKKNRDKPQRRLLTQDRQCQQGNRKRDGHAFAPQKAKKKIKRAKTKSGSQKDGALIDVIDGLGLKRVYRKNSCCNRARADDQQSSGERRQVIRLRPTGSRLRVAAHSAGIVPGAKSHGRRAHHCAYKHDVYQVQRAVDKVVPEGILSSEAEIPIKGEPREPSRPSRLMHPAPTTRRTDVRVSQEKVVIELERAAKGDGKNKESNEQEQSHGHPAREPGSSALHHFL